MISTKGRRRRGWPPQHRRGILLTFRAVTERGQDLDGGKHASTRLQEEKSDQGRNFQEKCGARQAVCLRYAAWMDAS